MSDHPNGNGYTAEVSALDSALDIRLGEIRAKQDAGDITVREALDLRVAVLEHHLEAVKALRTDYFGQSEQ